MKFEFVFPEDLTQEPKYDGRKTVLIEKPLEQALEEIPREIVLKNTRKFWRALVAEYHKKKQLKAS